MRSPHHGVLRSPLAACVGLLASAITGMSALAQTAHFSYALSTVGSGFTYPYGVGADASGNVYVADQLTNAVYKETLSASGSYTQNTVGSGFFSPKAVVSDANGNLYVVDGGKKGIVKETPNGTGGYTETTVSPNTLNGPNNDPDAIAVDGSGNVYVVNDGNFQQGGSSVIKFTPTSSGTYTYTTVVSGLTNANGVAVDSSGNVYVGVTSNGTVLKETPSGSGYAQTTIITGLDQVAGLAVDAAGDLYVVENGNAVVLKETPSATGGYTASTVVSKGLVTPQDVALGPNGLLYITDYTQQRVFAFQTAGVNFYAEPVGTASITRELTFTFDTAGALGSYSVLTQGVTGLDFQAAGTQPSTACTAGTTYAAGATCTVDVTFTPTRPGLRTGAVTLTNSSGTPIATGYVYGTGTGPQLSFQPAASSAVLSGLSQTYGLVVDGAGNLLYTIGGMLYRSTYNKSTDTYSTPTQVADGGVYDPNSAALDPTGDLFFGTNNGSIFKVVYSNHLYGPQQLIANVGTGDVVSSLLVDPAGNLFYTDSTAGVVGKVPLVNGNYGKPITLFSVTGATALGEDAAGDLFVGFPTGMNSIDPSDAVTEFQLVGLNSYKAVQVYQAGGIGVGIAGIAVEPSGSLLVNNGGILYRVPYTNGGYGSPGSLGALPGVVELDPAGNVLSNGTTTIQRIALGQPPTLNFGNVAANSTSATQTVTLSNDGNAALTFPMPTAGQNPSLSVPYSYSNSSSCPQLSMTSNPYTLASGTSCTATLSLTPTTAGTQAGQLVFTDNNLNLNASTTQTLQLTAMAYQITITPAGGTLPSATYSQSYSQTFTASGGSTAKYTYMISGSLPSGLSYTLSNNVLTLSGSPTSVGVYNFTIQATDGNGLMSASQNYSLTVNAATPTVTVSNSSATYGTSMVTLRAGIAYTGATAPTGTVTFTVNNTSYPGSCTSTSTARSCTANATVSSLAAGTYTVTVSEAQDANYNVASNAGTLSITAATPSVTINAPLSTTYGTATTTLSASVAYSGASAPTGTVTFTLNGIAYTGTCTTPSASPRTCTASANTSTLAAGGYTYGVSEAADTNYSLSSSTSTFTVTAATPTVTVLSGSVVYGAQSATLSANVAYSGSAAPTGAVTFAFNGVNYTASCMNGASSRTCTATVPTASLAVGSYTVTANQAADTNYMAASNSGTLGVTAATPSVTGVSTSAIYGTASTTLSANIAYTGSTAPTGTVTFVLNGASYTATCSTGASPRSCMVTAATSALAAGSYSFTVSEAADTNYAVASGTGTLTITAAQPTVTVNSASVVYGTASTSLTANVAYSGSASPTGAVTFVVNGASYTGTCMPGSSSRSCSATVTTSGLTAGGYTITVSEAADTNYALASNTATLTVTMATPVITTTPSSAVYGSSTALLSVNIAFTGSVAPTGVVTFAFNGTNYTGTCSVSGSTRTCTASAATSTLAAGSYSYTVSEAADTNYAAASGNGSVSVTGATPVVTANSASVIFGTTSTALTASIRYSGAAAPTGAVTFAFNGTNYTGTCSAVSGTRSCSATVPTAGLAVGSYSFSATEAADANYALASGNSTLTVAVATDFAFTGTGPAYQTVIPGNSANFTYSLSPTFASFPGTVTFTVTGLPAGATYSISPSTVAPTASAQTVTLTVQTAKPLSAQNMRNSPWSRGTPLALAALLLPFCFRRRMRNSLFSKLALLLLLAVGLGTAIGLTGCGTSNGFLEQPSTNYAVTVTATSNGVQHAATVTLNLQ